MPSFLLDLLASYEMSAQLTAIEEMIAQGADMQMVVRLVCLASIITGGIKSKTLEHLKREILQVQCHAPVYLATSNSVFFTGIRL